jgi:hypothetical protein
MNAGNPAVSMSDHTQTDDPQVSQAGREHQFAQTVSDFCED